MLFRLREEGGKLIQGLLEWRLLYFYVYFGLFLDSVEMLKRVFSIQENPYMLWKIIQELKGNRFFFDVFEVQRPEFGINYKEVNAMLMSKRAYEREYSGYKEQVDN